MPTLYEVTQAAARKVALDVFDIQIEVVENLLRNAKVEREIRERAENILVRFEADLNKAEADLAARIAAGAKETAADNLSAVRAQLVILKANFETDERKDTCIAFCARVRSWDLTLNGEPIPIETDSLYGNLEVPTNLLSEILTQLDNNPIIPKSSG